jgi:hypothetical protein
MELLSCKNGGFDYRIIEIAAGHLSILIPEIYGLVKERRLAPALPPSSKRPSRRCRSVSPGQ